MKRIILLLAIILSTKSFSQHFNPSVVNTTFLNDTEEHFRYMWFSSDNQKIYANDKTITVFSINGGKPLKKIEPSGHSLHQANTNYEGDFWIQGNYINNTEKDPNYSHIIPKLETCDLKTGKTKLQSTGKTFISKVLLSNDGKNAFGLSKLNGDEDIVQFTIEPFKVDVNITNESGYILAYDIHESTHLLVYSTGGKTASLKFFDLSSGELKSTMLKGKEISQIRISSDGKTIFASAYNILYKIDVATGKTVEFDVSKNDSVMYIYSMDVHPNNRSVAVSSKFGTSLIDTETGQIEKIDKGQSMGSNFSANGQYLVVSIKSWAGKTTCLALYEDKQFANSNFSSSNATSTDTKTDLVNKEEPKVEESEFLYESSEPKFSVICHAKPEETRKVSDKDRLTVSMKSTTKNLAGTITVIELPSSIKEKKYAGLTTSIGEKFVEKKDYEIIEKESIEIEGAEGIRYLLKLNNLYYDYRGVTTNGYTYQLVYIYDQKVKDLSPKDKFFNSFKIK